MGTASTARRPEAESRFRAGTHSIEGWARPIAARECPWHYRRRSQLFAALAAPSPPRPHSRKTGGFRRRPAQRRRTRTNVDYSSRSLARGRFRDFASPAALNFNGEGARLKFNGSIGATGLLYVDHSENNSFAPQVNLIGTPRGDRKVRIHRCPGHRQPNLRLAIRRPAGQPRECDPEPIHAADLRDKPLYPGACSARAASRTSFATTTFGPSQAASAILRRACPAPIRTISTRRSTRRSRQLGWSVTYNRFYYDNGIANVADVGYGATTDADRAAHRPLSDRSAAADRPADRVPEGRVSVAEQPGRRLRYRRAVESDRPHATSMVIGSINSSALPIRRS